MSQKQLLFKPEECPTKCPRCGGVPLNDRSEYIGDHEIKWWICDDCGFTWSETWKFVRWETQGGVNL